MMPQFAAILPPSVVVEQALVAAIGDVTLLPAEVDYAGAMVASRRREYVAGRACARLALSHLGFAGVAIPSGPAREPVWPAGIVGAITHTADVAAAAVARRSDTAAVGIDIEVAGSVDAVIRDLVLLPEEEAWLRDEMDDGSMATALFSAKESVFKAFYPVEQRWLGFEEVLLTRSGSPGRLRASFQNRGITVGGVRRTELDVRYLLGTSVVVTAVVIPAVESARGV
jgi:4'-phosphopantetheinyl transferase EntD